MDSDQPDQVGPDVWWTLSGSRARQTPEVRGSCRWGGATRRWWQRGRWRGRAGQGVDISCRESRRSRVLSDPPSSPVLLSLSRPFLFFPLPHGCPWLPVLAHTLFTQTGSLAEGRRHKVEGGEWGDCGGAGPRVSDRLSSSDWSGQLIHVRRPLICPTVQLGHDLLKWEFPYSPWIYVYHIYDNSL